MREERRLKVFENRVLRRIIGSKRDDVTVEWRRLNNKIEKNGMGGARSAVGGEDRCIQDFDGKT